ncbi:MAG: CPBP family intramembrane metalloprotease [Paludibacter sp.]|nr:CPBP family intramembrane metalloprotease [Paludibacter sp.]
MNLRGLLQQSGVGSKTIQLISLSVMLVLFFSFISHWVTGGDYSDVTALKLAQFLQSIGLFILPPFILAYLWSDNSSEYLQINRSPDAKSALLVIVMMVMAIPAINLLGELNHACRFPDFLSSLETYLIDLEKKAEELTNKMLMVSTVPELLVNVVLIAVVPAIGEELFFRGVIQKLLQERLKSHAAVWITAFIFSTIHFQFFGFIPRLLLGALMGYLLVWTNNLWMPILAHFTNNAMAVVFFYLKSMGKTSLDLEHIGSAETYIVGILSIVIVAVLIFLFRRLSRSSRLE